MQYTLRGIPRSLDAAVRERARVEGRSLNDVAVEAMSEGLGLGSSGQVKRDLSDVAGSWKKESAVDAALAAQDRIDPDDWK
jgi:hypothetical protein